MLIKIQEIVTNTQVGGGKGELKMEFGRHARSGPLYTRAIDGFVRTKAHLTKTEVVVGAGVKNFLRGK